MKGIRIEVGLLHGLNNVKAQPTGTHCEQSVAGGHPSRLFILALQARLWCYIPESHSQPSLASCALSQCVAVTRPVTLAADCFAALVTAPLL